MTRREEIVRQAEMFRQPYRGSGNYSTSMDIKNAFQEGAEWADKTMIEKACEILKNVIVTYNRRFFGKCEENAFDADFIKNLEKQWRNSMKMWIARDKCGILCIHREEPILIGTVWDSNDWWGTDSEEYPSVTFENSPKEVELVDKNEFDSFVEIKEKYEDFLGIVAEMRHLQKEQDTAGIDWNNTPYYKSLHKRMIELQEEVDRWLDLN